MGLNLISLLTILHILTAMIAFGILGVAGIQALMLHFQNESLRNKHGNTLSRNGLLKKLPPLERMESLLFQMILFGFIILTISLFTALCFNSHFYAFSHWHKIVLSFLAWIFFAILLYKHYRFGWRGKSAIIWTLTGLTILLLAYLSSKSLQ